MCDLLEDYSLPDEEEEAKKEEESKKQEKIETKVELKNIFLPPPGLHPVNFVDFIEHNYSYFFTQTSPDDYYQLSSYKTKNNIKFTPLQFSPKANLSKIIFDNIDISSIAIHDDFLFTGDANGLIHIYSCESESEVKTLKYKDLNEKFDKNNRAVSSLDISQDGLFLIAGYSNGFITLWSIQSQKLITIITDKHASRIVALKFIFATEKKFVLISSDQNGQVQKLIIEKGIFGYKSAKDDSIYKDSLPTFIIELYRPSERSSLTLAVLGTVQKIKLYKLEPFVTLLFEFDNPEKTQTRTVPDVSFGIGTEPKMDGMGLVNQIMGPDEDEVIKNELMLAISWDKIIKIYSINIDNNGGISLLNDGKPCGFFLNAYSVSRLGFISSSIVYFFDMQKQIKIFNTSLIQYGDYDPENKKHQEYNTKALIEEGTVIDPLILADDISFQNKKQYSYRNFIIGTDKSICLLCRHNFHRGKLLSYEECINKVADENNWMDALCIGLDIFRGTLTSFPDIPVNDKERKEKLIPFLQDLILLYINKNLKKERGNALIGDNLSVGNKDITENFNKCMIISIEFCIGFKAANFLFTEIQDFFKGYGDTFFKNVEPFIFSDILKNEKINDQTISSLFAAYCTMNELGIFSHLLTHLNYYSINNDFIKSVILKYNLFTALIYIYSNSNEYEENFLPIIQMFNYFINDKNIGLNGVNYSDFESYNDIIKQKGLKIVEKMQYFIGHKLLWYIDMCFNGKKLCLNINDNESFDVNSKNFQGLIALIYSWVLSKKVFNTLIQFDSYTFFFVLTKLFSHDYLINIIKNYDFSTLPKHFISEESELLSDSKTEDKPNTSQTTEGAKEEEQQKKSPYNDIKLAINHIIKLGKEFKSIFIRQDMDLFIVKIAAKLKENVVPKECVISAVKSILSYYSEVAKLSEKDLSEDKFKCHGINLKGSDYTNLEQVSENVKNYINDTSKFLITLLSSQYKFTSDDFSSMLIACEYTHYIFIKIKLLEMNKEYVECLKVYIKNEKFIGGKKIFEWINLQLKTLSKDGKKEDDPNFIELKKTIVDNTITLAEISLDSVLKIFNEYYANDKKTDIITKFEPNPEFQYKYIEKLLNDKNSIFNTIDDNFDANLARNPKAMTNSEIKKDLSSLLMLHFDLLIKLNKKDEILKNLKKRYIYYPIDECIQKCVDNKITDSGIFLYQSIGDYQKAIELALTDLNETFDALYQNQDESQWENLFSKSREDLEKCIEICESNNDQEAPVVDKQGDSLWFEILKAMYDFFNKASKSKNTKILDSISNEIENLLKKMCLYVKMKEILEFIIQNYEESEFKEFKNLIIKIMQSFGRYNQVLKTAKVLLANSLVYNTNNFNRVKGLGKNIIIEKCDWCRKRFIKGSNELLIIFLCGHKMHSKCNYKDGQIYNPSGEPICMICQKNDFEKGTVENKNEEVTTRRRGSSAGSKDENYLKEKEKREALVQKRKRLEKLKLVDKKYLEKLEELA